MIIDNDDGLVEQVRAGVSVTGSAGFASNVDETQDAESRLQREFQLRARLPGSLPAPSHAQGARRPSIAGVGLVDVAGVLSPRRRTGPLSPD